MDVRRVVEVWNPVAGCAGTGYVVADRIVLTALHNAVGAERLEVRRLDPDGRERWAGADLLWPEREQDPRVDVALIRVTGDEWTPPSGAAPVRWGRIDTAVDESRLDCLAVGFPRSEARDGVRDTKEIRGHVEALTGLKSGGGRITVHVDGVATPSNPDAKSRWSGASGAALFARGRLIGVVTTDRARDYAANQLTAVSVASLAARPGFAMAVRAAGGDLVLEDVMATTDAGPPRTAYDIEVPRGIHNLRELPHRFFVGRDEALATLSRAMSEESQTITQTLHGLGGVGKTTLALHYAHGHRDAYRLVWWIEALSPDSIDASLAELTRRLRGDLGPTLATAQAASWAIGWLQTHPGWLLVFDNALRPEDVRRITGQLRGTGRQLITSRYKEGWSGDPIPLPVLDSEASQDLLARLTHGGDEEEARALAEELGHLPLALEQAGSFIKQASITIGEYREMLRDDAKHTTAAPRDWDPARTMAGIWRITLDALHDRDPRAVDLLRIAAWYAPTGIPRETFARLAENPVDLAELLALLANYSMITLDRSTLGVHRLVQTVARTPSAKDPHRTGSLIIEARDMAAAWICEMLPGDPRGDVAAWPTWRRLLPHAEALLSAWSPADDTEATCVVLNLVAAYLEGQGEVRKAIGFFRRAAESADRVLGADHPGTLRSWNNLACAYESAGDLGRAIPLYERTLTDSRRVLGADHPDALRSQNNLAFAYGAAGDLGRATPLYERTVADLRRVLGADHPETLKSRSNLALAYRSAGEVDRAITLHEQILADRVRVLGEDHPDTLKSRSNLAGAYGAMGDVGRAITLHEQVLADRVRVLREAHPDTLLSLSNLAGAYQAAGDAGRALPLYEQALADCVRVLGPDSPQTLTAQNNLATAYEAAGDVRRAISLYEQVVAACRRVLGADHPHSLASRNSLAHAHRSAGDAGRALEVFEQVLADRMRVFGADHPDTLAARNNVAAAHHAAGDGERALEDYEQVLTHCMRVLGADHPTTEAVRRNLAAVQRGNREVNRTTGQPPAP
ncbi:tetratricopeptide repeat-containing serine protease family protein [Streptomyces sp. KL118A]|uniref:tetratricopeptide repeat-containing serine protease family protein n=1 Tax=Streptomyces sp. KL118A TaxID=3045153 RepID=UPI00278BD402|nr:tetratricopeptide repeat-containing serine protease family protein [Streptomyces sp. KL118A]